MRWLLVLVTVASVVAFDASSAGAAAGRTATESGIPVDAPAAYPSSFVLTQAAEGTQTGDNGQGSAITISNGVAAVSSGGGSVYVYSIDPLGGTWTLQTTLTKDSPSGTGKGSHLWGTSLAFNGEVLAVGDPDENCDIDGRCSGQVVLYLMGADPATWTYWATVDSVDPLSQNKIGSSVAVSQNWLIAGAPSDSPPTPLCLTGDIKHCGSDEYFEIWDISNTSSAPTKAYHARRRNFVSGLGGEFGHAVAIGEYPDGSATAFITQPGEQSICYVNYYAKGSESSPSWHEDDATPCSVTPELLSAHPSFGTSVAFSSESGTLLVGDPNNGSGKVWVYRPTVNGLGASQVSLTPPTGVSSSAKFGQSVAMSPGSSFAVIGMPGEAAGEAFGFASNDGGQTFAPFPDVATFLPSGSAASGSAFGSAVAVDNARTTTQDFTIGVGAPKQDGTNGQKGYAYFFSLLGAATLSMTVDSPLPVPVVAPGGVVSVTFTLTNESQVAASNLVVTNTQDAYDVVSGSTSWEATSGWGIGSDWTCASGADPPTCTTASFPPGASTTFTASYTLGPAPVPFPAAQHLLTDLAYASWDNPPLGSVSASTSFFVGPPADATIDVALVSPAPPAIATFGEPITFDVTVHNTSGSPMLDAVVSTTTPEYANVGGTTLALSTATPGWNCTDLPGQCRADEVPAGATVAFTGVVTGAYDVNVPSGPAPGTANLTYLASLWWSNGVSMPAQDSATASVGDIVQVSAVNQAPPGLVEPGSNVTWTYTVQNSGDVDARLFGIYVEPSSMTDVRPTSSNSTWDCDVPQLPHACAIPGQLLAPGASVTFTVTGKIDDGATGAELLASVEYDAPPHPVGSLIRYQQLTSVAVGDFGEGSVAVTGSSGVTPFYDAASLGVTATNTGSTAALTSPQLTVELAVDTGGVGTSAITAPVGWTCVASDPPAPEASSTSWLCTGGDLAVAASASFVVTASGTLVTGDQHQYFDTAVPNQVFTLSAELSWANVGSGFVPPSTSGQAMLGLPFVFALTQGPGEVSTGTAASWTWSVTNVANVAVDAEHGAVLFDPGALTDLRLEVSDDGHSWRCDGPVCLAPVGRTVAAGDVVTMTLHATVGADGTELMLHPEILYTNFDVFVHQSVATTTPMADAALSLVAEIADGPASRAAGAPVALRVVASNAGPGAAAGLRYTFDVPTGLRVQALTLPDGTRLTGAAIGAAATSSGWACTVASGAISCATATLAPGANHTFLLDASVDQATAPGTQLVFRSSVAAATPDSQAADNSASVTVVVAAARSGSLPITGIDATRLAQLLVAAAGLVVLGAGALVLSRRRSRR
ncbi:MAG: hypothetical protein KDB33_07285 [Acidimicrobiales bacterium]|nr:hypothetical protein [Acidimicrobiales bacterium]